MAPVEICEIEKGAVGSPGNNWRKYGSRKNILTGNFFYNSYFQVNLGKPYFIENKLLENMAPCENMCDKIDSPKFNWE
jgi:hypothetical protein